MTTSKLYLNQHLQKHNGNQISFTCKICEKQFSHRSSMLRHQNLHLKNRGKLYKCSVCFLLVRSYSELVEHTNLHSSTENTHVCDTCHKSYKSKKILGMHMKRHLNAKYVCDICDKQVHSKYELRIHQGTHNDYKLFECFHCDKRFSFKNTLMRHIKYHYSRIRSDIEI